MADIYNDGVRIPKRGGLNYLLLVKIVSKGDSLVARDAMHSI